MTVDGGDGAAGGRGEAARRWKIIGLIGTALACLILLAVDVARNRPVQEVWRPPWMKSWIPRREEAEAVGAATRAPPGSSRLSRLFVRAPALAEADDDLRFGDFMDALRGGVRKHGIGGITGPAVREFAAQPRLREVYDDFSQAELQGRRVSAVGFLSVLGRIKDFRTLAAKFASQPGAVIAVLSLLQDPAVKKVVQASDAKAPSRRQESDEQKGRLREKSPSAREARSGMGGAQSQSGLMQAAFRGGAFGAASARKTAAGSGADTRVRQPAVGEADSVSGDPQGQSSTARAATNTEAGAGNTDGEGVTPMTTAKDAKTDPMAVFCAAENYKWLCDVLSGGQRAALYGAIGEDGLWGACWKLSLYDLCASACGSSGGKCGRRAEAWPACMEASGSSELGCIRELRERGSYSIPSEVVARNCVARYPAAPAPECGSLGQVVGQPAAAAPAPGADTGNAQKAGGTGDPAPDAGGDPAPACDPAVENSPCHVHTWGLCVDAATQTLFNATHGEENAADRWTWEHANDRVDPNWRDLPIEQGGYGWGGQ